jgi:hypothetical protein
VDRSPLATFATCRPETAGDGNAATAGGGEPSTEELRQAIRRYRSFFNRLLSV